jgi:hypothetical protein
MKKTACLMRPESLEGRCPVAAVRRSVGLKIIDADFFWQMHVPTGFGEKGWHMAASTIGLTIKHSFDARGCRFVEATWGWFRRADRELIKMQCGKLGGD